MCSHFFSRIYYIYSPLMEDGTCHGMLMEVGGQLVRGQVSFHQGDLQGSSKLKSSGLVTRASVSWTIWPSLQILTSTHLYLRFLKHYLPLFPICFLLRKLPIIFAHFKPTEAPGILCLNLSNTGLTGVCPCTWLLCGYWRNLNSDPHACLASTSPAGLAIQPTHLFFWMTLQFFTHADPIFL